MLKVERRLLEVENEIEDIKDKLSTIIWVLSLVSTWIVVMTVKMLADLYVAIG